MLSTKTKIKNNLVSNIKNIPGWKTKRKLVSFAVDDYGNIRLAGLKEKQNLQCNGVNLTGRFDHYDALDTRQDYEQLFKVLESVRDKRNRHAVFTTYAMPANVDYERTLQCGEYVAENLDVTYDRLSEKDKANFEGAFTLLREGINRRILRPQFHGREHLNILAFNKLLRDKNPVLLANLHELSLAGIPNHINLPNIGFHEAFSLQTSRELEIHKTILEDGLNRFDQVYGYRPLSFTPPAMLFHPQLYPFVESLGIEAIDKPRRHQVHMGDGIFKKEINRLGIQKNQKHVTVVRNCMFEPNAKNIDWVNFTLDQIKAAFFWGKPAIISSHRVNFCGHIDPENRKKGLVDLQNLLNKVVQIWPDVEFVSVDELAECINRQNS